MSSSKLNHQVQTGIYNLDHFICGGYPISGVTLIEEDEFACLSNLLLNCTISNYLNDGKQLILSLPAKIGVECFLKELPQRTISNPEDQPNQSMKIAWRYSNLSGSDEVSSSNKNEFSFDLKNKLDESSRYRLTRSQSLKICTHNELFNELKSKIKTKTKTNKQLVVIRNYATIDGEFDEKKFCTFLFKLKSLSRAKNQCFILTINSNYLSPLIRELSINIVDCSFQIERLSENSVYKDYLGLIKINKLPKINSLNYQTTTETLEIGIQLKKSRILNVEKLFLPPELSDAPSRVTAACSSTKIDF